MNTLNKLKNIPAVLLYTWIISFHISCDSKPFGQQADSLFLETSNLSFHYDLKRPSEKYFLPYVLEEVSGLSFKAPNHLLAVDDETGKIFEYDIKERKIVHSIEFQRPDDYEGVELVNDTIYVLRNDGDIFSFKYDAYKKVRSRKSENELSKKNDTEGLGYDPRFNELLIACKENGGIEDKKLKGRCFYTYSIGDNKLRTEPLFCIRPKHLKAFWEQKKEIDYNVERIKFKPSAISLHPIDNNYYILSSVGKLLVVVTRDGTIQATYPISPKVLGQPEGLCFDPNGDMYISSEGEGDRGYILKFPMIKD
ncbi:MAG: SdiA-regulated domain-containing protein [Bacteroidota bacterium]